MTLRFALVAFLALAACSVPGQHHEFHQAPMLRPPPRPAAPPPPGAPSFVPEAPVHAPDFSRPQVPRSPHKRQLPPSREPGLWSGDGPRAANPPLIPLPMVLGVQLPYIDDAKDADRMFTLMCANSISRSLHQLDRTTQLKALNLPTRRCFAGTLYAVCSKALHSIWVANKQHGLHYDAAELRSLAAMREVAEAFEAKVCTGFVPDDDAKELLGLAVVQLKRETRVRKE